MNSTHGWENNCQETLVYKKLCNCWELWNDDLGELLWLGKVSLLCMTISLQLLLGIIIYFCVWHNFPALSSHYGSTSCQQCIKFYLFQLSRGLKAHECFFFCSLQVYNCCKTFFSWNLLTSLLVMTYMNVVHKSHHNVLESRVSKF